MTFWLALLGWAVTRWACWRVSRLLFLAVASLALAIPATAAPKPDRPEHWQPGKGNQAWQWRTDVWLPAHWRRLAECESGSRPPNWKHDSGAYVGAFGFARGSWSDWRLPGYPRNATDASPFQQFKVARRIAARYGIASPWGCWRGPQHAWVRGSLPEYGVYR